MASAVIRTVNLIFINVAPMPGYMLQFSQAPAGVCFDSNEFGVFICNHRLISFVNWIVEMM